LSALPVKDGKLAEQIKGAVPKQLIIDKIHSVEAQR
jgi:hypothetical protein